MLRGVPTHVRSRFRIADTLLSLDGKAQALEVYKALAWHEIKMGQPLKGLVAIKMATFLDPSATDAIEILSQLYSRGSERVGAAQKPLLPLSNQQTVGEVERMEVEELVQLAAQEAANTDGIANYPHELPPIPLFSFLDEDAFAGVLDKLSLKRFVAGQKIITQNEAGDAIYILAEGDVDVSRDMNGKTAHLAKLHAGSVFGEMALISNRSTYRHGYSVGRL